MLKSARNRSLQTLQLGPSSLSPRSPLVELLEQASFTVKKNDFYTNTLLNLNNLDFQHKQTNPYTNSQEDLMYFSFKKKRFFCLR